MSKFKYKKDELKLANEILKDFLKDFDMKKLVAEFFAKLYDIKQFDNFTKEDELTITFPFGRYEFRLQRRPINSNVPIINPIIMRVLDDSKIALGRTELYNKILKRKL